ncbi:RagB/SusD family nutrient uptake outer membrane protein [Labilibacter marinus]|uniref:RagB/SusD family nutrient uptake outer membrane protein n=1 Tax=Labilibacter marinus TaxID=1477105 RepID=UPI00094FFA36|nr:RagB/SusD family nutrient uptake outer membrane protein [Labilibacter marinus]
MKQIQYIFIFVVLILAASCSDSFLETDPVNRSTEDKFYQTDAQMFAALIAAYDPLQWGGMPASFVPFGEIRSDNMKTGGGGEGDQPDMQAIESFTNNSVNEASDKIWSKNYTGIYRTNLVINSPYESEVTAVYKAEAQFLRAWYHFDLLRTYGPCPVVTETIFAEDHKFVREDRATVNALIISDLKEAIEKLEDKHGDANVGRATIASAQALLGKVLIYKADWDNDNAQTFDEAATYLRKVVDNDNYSLVTDYSELFAPKAENNSESIFEIQRTTKGGKSNWSNVDQTTEGNFWAQFSGPRGYPGNEFIDGGWGFLLPQNELMDAFLPDDVDRKAAVSWTYDDLVTDYNEGRPEEEHVIWQIDQYNQVDFVGYAQRKYSLWKEYDYVGGLALNRPGSERVIRLADVYLMLAECKLRGTADVGTAKDLINEVRKNHVYKGADVYDGVDELLTKYPERFNSVLDVLWYERRVELAGEGDRWYDLVRSGRAPSVMGAIYPGVDWSKHIYIPIGLTEQGNSGNSLTEYPSEPLPH